MRVLQTLGTTQPGGPHAFRYGRTRNGDIRIEVDGRSHLIPNAHWNALINAILDHDDVFGIAGTENRYFRGDLLQDFIPRHLQNDGQINAGYYAAILVHEGVLLLHHGQLPERLFDRNNHHPFEARIYLKRSAQ